MSNGVEGNGLGQEDILDQPGSVGKAGTPQTKGYTREEWRRRILEELGGDGVDPELSASQLDSCLRRALELWDRYRPCRMWWPFDIPASETAVISFFADEAHTSPAGPDYVRNIIRVDFSDRDRRLLGPRAGFLEGYYLRWGFEGPRLFFQLHMAQRRYERLTGSRPDWYWNPTDRKLYISSPGRDTRAMVLATRENNLEGIPYDHVSLFLQAATARAKYILARTIGSKGPIAGGGMRIETDAQLLRDEGREEWKDVSDQLQNSMLAVPPPGYLG